MEKSHFEYRQDFERLLQESNLLQAQIGALEQDSKALRESISNMRKAQEYLSWDVNELYGTIRADIERKNNIITDLRRRLIECGVTPRNDATKNSFSASASAENSCPSQVQDMSSQNNVEQVTDERQPNLELCLSPKVDEQRAKPSTHLDENNSSRINCLNDVEKLTQPATELRPQNLVELPAQQECTSPERCFSSEEVSDSISECIERNENIEKSSAFVGSLEGYRIPKKKHDQPKMPAPSSRPIEDSEAGRCRNERFVGTEPGECSEEGEIDGDDREIVHKPTEMTKTPNKINRPYEDFGAGGIASRPAEDPRNTLNFDSRRRHPPETFHNYGEWRRWDENNRRINKWRNPNYTRRPNPDFPRNDRDGYKYSDQKHIYYNQRIPRQDRLVTLDLADHYSRGNIRDSDYQSRRGRERRLSVDSIDSLQRVSYQPEPDRSRRSTNLIGLHPESRVTNPQTEEPALDGSIHKNKEGLDFSHDRREHAKPSSAEKTRSVGINETKDRDRKIGEKSSSKERGRDASSKSVGSESKRYKDTSKERIKKNAQEKSSKDGSHETKQHIKDTVSKEKKTRNDGSSCKTEKENKSATEQVVTETKIQKQHGRKSKEKSDKDEKQSKVRARNDKKRTKEVTPPIRDNKRRKVNENVNLQESNQKHPNKVAVRNGDDLIQSSVQPGVLKENAPSGNSKTKQDSSRKDDLHYLFGDYSSDSSSTSTESSEDIRPISLGRKDKSGKIQANQKTKTGKTNDKESDDCRIFERTRSRAKSRIEQTRENKFEVYKEQRSIRRSVHNNTTSPEKSAQAQSEAPSVGKTEEHAVQSPPKDGAAQRHIISESFGAEMSGDGSIPVMHIPDLENPIASGLLETSFIKSVIDCNSTFIDEVLNGCTATTSAAAAAPQLNPCTDNNNGSAREDPAEGATGSSMLMSNDSNASEGQTTQLGILQNDLHLSFDSSGNENTVVKKTWVSPNRRRRKVTMFLNPS